MPSVPLEEEGRRCRRDAAGSRAGSTLNYPSDMGFSAPALGLLAFVAAPLIAAAQTAPNSTGGVAQLARNKEAMVARMLNESPLAMRIAASNNADAQALYRVAQTAFVEAKSALEAGDPQRANAAFDSALQLMHLARKLLPSDLNATVDQNARFAAQLKSVESLKQSYRDRVTLMRGAKPGTAEDTLLGRIDMLVDQARRQAAAGHVEDGVTSLLDAERRLTDGLTEAIGSATVEYRRANGQPDQQLRDELARNQSFVELVPIAVSQLRPPPETVAAMNHLVEANLSLRKLAEQQATAHNTEAAIATLRQATESIEQMLQQAGLKVLQAPKD
jgi:hypothetical protein